MKYQKKIPTNYSEKAGLSSASAVTRLEKKVFVFEQCEHAVA